jgi:hypothetical protein
MASSVLIAVKPGTGGRGADGRQVADRGDRRLAVLLGQRRVRAVDPAGQVFHLIGPAVADRVLLVEQAELRSRRDRRFGRGAPAAVGAAEDDEPDGVLALGLQRLHQPGDLAAQVGKRQHAPVHEGALRGRGDEDRAGHDGGDGRDDHQQEEPRSHPPVLQRAAGGQPWCRAAARLAAVAGGCQSAGRGAIQRPRTGH